MRISPVQLSFALCVCALLSTPVLAAPIRVAVEQGTGVTSGTGASVVSQLNDDTFFDFQATLVTAADIDTASELANYDVVVFGDSGSNNNDWSAAMAAALKAAVSAGTLGVVSTGWVDYAVRNSAPRDSDLDDVMPIDAYPDSSNHYCNSGGTLTITNNTHPVTQGVTTFTTASANIEISPFAPDTSGGLVLGTASASSCTNTVTNALVVGEVGSSRTVYLGLLYMANSSYNPADLRSGMADRLLEQAVAWASPNQTPRPVADSQTVTLPEEGSATVTLTGTDPEGDPLTFTLVSQPMNGVLTGTAPNFTYTPAANFSGTDLFTFTVTDGTTTSSPGTVTLQVTPINDVPVAGSLAVSVDQGSNVTITLPATDADADSLVFSLTTPPSHGTLTGLGPQMQYTPAQMFRGMDTFKFIASDATTSSQEGTVTITVVNLPPTLSISADATRPLEGAEVQFTAIVVDPGADTTTIEWDFGDGQTSNELSPKHAFGQDGSYTVTATVSDGELTAQQSLTLEVQNASPTLSGIVGPEAGDEGAPLTFSAAAMDPGSSDPLTFTWNWGDGSADSAGESAIHTYADDGSYFITLTVTDDDGAQAVLTRSITIVNISPKAIDPGPQTTTVGAMITVQLAASDPARALDPLAWTLISGNGQLLPGGLYTFTPTAEQTGRNMILARVTDDDGGSTDLPFAIDVEPDPATTPAGGCGCAAGAGSAQGASLLLLALGMLARRRRG